MAIVGTAYVRLRVIGDKLKNDITAATTNAVKDSAPQLSDSGKEVGEKISDGVSDSLNKSVGSKMGKVADDIGDAIGKRMAENMGKSLRKRAGNAITEGFSTAKNQISSLGDRFKPQWEQVSSRWSQLTGKNFGQKLRGALVGGIAFAITALPSALAFTGAIAGALVATLVPAIGMIGPVAAGAALTAVAAFSTIKISAGLLGLAMKTETAALTGFQDNLQSFKDSIGTPIQEGLLSGFNAALRIARPIVGAITPQLREMGFVVGDVAIGFADAFRQGAMLERLQRILTVNNDALRLGGEGATGLAQAFAVLLDHLSPIILYLASGLRDLGNWANTSILAAEATGRLDSFIATMFNNLTRFVGILVDFGVGIWNVFRAASGESAGMMTSLEGIAARFREWTGDPANQERMVTFFANMRTIASEVLSIFGELAGASGRALEGTNVESVLGGLRNLVDVGKAVGGIFEQIRASAGPALTDAFMAFADMITDLAESGVIGVMATAFANLFRAISFLLNIPGVAPLLSLIGGLAALFHTVKFLMAVLKPLQIVFTIFRVVLVALAGVIGWLPIVIGLVVAALIWFFTQTELGRDIIAAVWEFIKNAIEAAIDGIIAAWDWLVSAFQATVDAVSTALGAMRDFFVNTWDAIWGVIQPVIQGIWDFIVMVVSGIVTAVQAYLNILYEIWIRVWPILALPIRVLYGVIMLIFQGIVAFITWAIGAIWTVVTTVWNAIWGFIQPVLQAIWDFITMVWDGIVTGITWYLNMIWTVITTVWGAVWGFIQPILQRIGDFISGVWNGIVGGVTGALNAIWGVITRVWNNVTSFISGAMDVISGLITGAWDMLSGVGTAVLDGIKAAVNVVIDVINTVISGINWAIELANKLPGADIPTIPDIPRLARGGIIAPTNGGTVAMIAEAGRSERVEPLDPSGLSRRDRAMINMLAGGGAAGATVHVYLGTREIEDIVDVVVEDKQSGLADRVLTGTKG